MIIIIIMIMAASVTPHLILGAFCILHACQRQQYSHHHHHCCQHCHHHYHCHHCHHHHYRHLTKIILCMCAKMSTVFSSLLSFTISSASFTNIFGIIIIFYKYLTCRHVNNNRLSLHIDKLQWIRLWDVSDISDIVQFCCISISLLE